MYKCVSQKQNFVFVLKECRQCRIRESFINSGRVSFMLSGKPTTQRQWDNIGRFAKLLSTP